MHDSYRPPEADLLPEEPQKVHRPQAVFIIGLIFIGLALIDLLLTLKSGLVQHTFWQPDDGDVTGNYLHFEVLWLILYGIGAGVMRGGKFARFMACLLGIFCFIVPGLVAIYILYFGAAKDYFNHKHCESCGDTKYKNVGFRYQTLACKKCGKIIPLS